MADYSSLIAAGVQIAGGYLADNAADDNRAQSKENLLLQLADNERDREAARLRGEVAAQAGLEGAKISAEASKENTKKRILGNAILDKGKDEGAAMMADQQSSANKPERFNAAANNLAAVLGR